LTTGPVIVLLGISGVGKSRLARSIAIARPAILRLTASELLRSSLHTTGERLRTASSAQVRGNQTQLGPALAKARENNWCRPVLLEAHSFIDNDRELVDVPTSVMRELGACGFLILEAPPADIYRHREEDSRIRPTRDIDELDRQQRHGRQLARQYATELNVPLRFVGSDDKEAALSFVDEVLSRPSP
jgi:adenylate kinase